MELDWLERYLAVVDRGGFTAASAQVRRSQSRVGAHIAALERELGVLLIDRSRRPANVRPAGRTFATHAREILADVRSARSAIGVLGSMDEELLAVLRSARGVLRLVDDDLEAARADLESAASTKSRLGILNTSAFSFAYLARTEWVAGAWDDALPHAERAVAIDLESDFGFTQTAVLGIAVLVPEGRGDWATADSYLAAMAAEASNYDRPLSHWRCRAPGWGKARGRPADVPAALEPVSRFPNREGADEPGFGPGRISMPMRWSRPDGWTRPTISAAVRQVGCYTGWTLRRKSSW